MAVVIQDGLMLEFFPDFFKSNRDLVVAALKQNGLALQFASKAFQSDK